MTNTYNTLNPLGSTSPKDLYDNASNFDEAMNSLGPAFYDRFLRRRETWTGMEARFNDSMNNWDAEFQAFLAASGFEPIHLVYVDGSPLTVDRPTQLIDRAGISYRIKVPSSFPVVLTGTWATDLPLLVDIADAGFKSDLASSDLNKGASLVGRAIVVINNVAELLTFTPATNGLQVYLKGYFAAYPGMGDGVLTWDASSNLDTDGGTVFKPTSVSGSGRFLRALGVFRFEDFGCIGDGSTDNYTSLTAALSSPRVHSLTSQVGSAAHYRHSATLVINKSILLDSDYAGFTLDDPSGLLDNFRIGDNVTQLNGVRFKHNILGRVQGGHSNSCAIRMNFVATCKIEGNRIYGDGKIYDGIVISRGLINDFVSNYIDNCIRNGVTITGTDMASNRSIDNSFYMNRIEGGSSAMVAGDFVEGVFVRHNIFYNTSQNGVVVTASSDANAGVSFKFQENDFDTCGQAGLSLDKVSAWLVQNNWFSNNSGTGATGVNIGAQADGGVLSGNLSFGTSGCNNFNVLASSVSMVGNVLIGGNDGIVAGTTSTDLTLSGNRISYMSGYALNAFNLPDGLLIDSSNRLSNIGQAQPIGLPNSQAGSYLVEPFGGYNTAVTYDPPSIAPGAVATTIISLASAQLGDFVQVSFTSPNSGVRISAFVTTIGNIEVLFQNTSGATVDLGSGILRVALRKLR